MLRFSSHLPSLFLLLGLLVATSPGQGVRTPDPTLLPLEAGRRALEAGKREEALHHFLNALPYAPDSAEILQLLLATASEDPDARALWSHAWYTAQGDEAGKAKPDRDARGVLVEDDGAPAKLAAQRAAAVGELIAYARKRSKKGGKSPGELLVGNWARRAALDLVRGAPALFEAHRDELRPAMEAPRGFDGPTLRALERAMKRALDNRETGDAVLLARCLQGFVAQSRFDDLQGEEPPSLDRYAEAASVGLARAREQFLLAGEEPWTLEQLEWLTEEEGEAFTRAHDSFANPGVGTSPRGWYRVETDCGYETLLGVVRTIELHHERLAFWYEQDPFEGKPGIARIVPEAHGLEAEGSPHWWAGGFQGGNVTTLRFSCGTIEGLGHGITHELTHRFDGAIYPGQPAWLSEGKAVWTGAAYGHSTDGEFVEMHALFGTVERAFVQGYGNLEKLTKLIDGTFEDYRDTYFAGYALYLYLNSWEEEGSRIYRDRLQRFMENASKGANDREAQFVEHFCDGKEGRPADLEEFGARFGKYISGFYWKDRQPWTDIYTREVPTQPSDGWVYDEPTWTWSRARAEPCFGQDQAREAGLLLLEKGRPEDAIHAMVWGLCVDGRTPLAEGILAPVLRDAKQHDAAWILEHARAFPASPAATPAPFANDLPRTRSYLETLAETVGTYREAGLDFAAASLAGDHDRLAAWLGLEPLRVEVPERKAALHPFDARERLIGLAGWKEEGLTGFEERRVPGLWYEDEKQDLHVGREKPRSGTGKLDRRAHQRHAFVRTEDWLLPGTYRIRARIQFTTSYVSGAMLIGSTRRDRNLRLQFNAGDFMYAIGESEEEPTFESFHWSVTGLRDRDGPLSGSLPRGKFEFDHPVPAFDLELFVDGPAVEVTINGRRVGLYHTVDGAPIEGYLGFATGMGAIRVQKPTVQRIDRSRAAERVAAAPLGLALSSTQTPDFEDLENRSLFGLPFSPNGRLVLWIPEVAARDGGVDLEQIDSWARRGSHLLSELLYRDGVPQPFVVIVPETVGEEERRGIETVLAAELDTPIPVLRHALPGEARGEGGGIPDHGKRWLFFVDSSDIVRVAAPFLTQSTDFSDRLDHWLRVFRDHGRPVRELPEVPRWEPEPDEDEEELGD